jgi:cytochrome c2
MIRLIFFLFITVTVTACAGKKAPVITEAEGYSIVPAPAAAADDSYDIVKGEGKFTHAVISPQRNNAMAAAGEKIYKAKCMVCHKLTGEKLTGPGLKGVTQRRHPAWVLNFISNTDAMLRKDPQAKLQLELCNVRMPNLNLTDTEVMAVYEFLRRNDAVKN